MQGQDFRIFFLNTFSGLARKIICYVCYINDPLSEWSNLSITIQAHNQNYTFPRYVFMNYDWYPPEWWTYERSQIQVNCKDEDLTKFIERSLSVQFRPVSDDDNATTDTGKVRLLYMAMGRATNDLEN